MLKDNLWKLTGEDYIIIGQSNKKVQLFFSFIGILVLVILLVCFISAVYFIEHLFHNKILDIFIGLLWGFIITNLYILMLYTMSPTIFSNKSIKKGKIKKESHFTVSLILRLLMVILLATITAQPLVVLTLKEHNKSMIYNIIELWENQSLIVSLCTIVIVMIFLIPIILKYRIRLSGDFFAQKRIINQKFVLDNYQDFKKKYRQILEEKIQEYNQKLWVNLHSYLESLKKINPELHKKFLKEIQEETTIYPMDKYEYWEDSPFRTKKKIFNKNLHSENELLNFIYKNN